MGVVVAIGEGVVGWSGINPNGKDRWNKRLGMQIAEGRAKNGSRVKIQNPAIEAELKNMHERSLRYFNPEKYSKKLAK